MDDRLKKKILSFQKNELTEYFIYVKLASLGKNTKNKEVLEKFAADEMKHYHIWKKYTQDDVAADRFKVWKYFLIARFLGLTFGLKLMEGGEEKAQITYEKMTADVAEAADILRDEDTHERELLEMIDEDKLKYVGSIVLGLNDALVELTGALAGLTFALPNARLVATAGAITGIAAALSMAASEFLSTKSEDEGKNPLKASIYTGITYILTVTALVMPYLFFQHVLVSLSIMLANAVVIIFIFTFYISVAKGLDFRKRFLEMVSISLGVATLSFLIGLGVRALLGIEV
ncbi:MAG: VIT1/CCC1 transporter family protein [Candidatus Omnitrophica bacterium]|nr:VIT1/CCC1 transporter family protein [Candidatus Omnitrophota bacterium]MDD5610682.1 VIT1/CCC1 transporter family protein [Candidatus Omnitrophota bacterium]